MSAADGGLTPVEAHLGDRLAALVDGELGHDARERVLAHLATCHSCKAEADAQRRLKSVFADTAPPPPSDGLLARLQGLPGGVDVLPGEDDRRDGRGPGAPGPSGPVWSYQPLPGGREDGVLGSSRGFRTHRPSGAERGEDRSGPRGRRFAFAAAGAVSMAALALGGALGPVAAGSGAVAAGGPGSTSAGPAASPAAGSERDGRRRTGGAERLRPKSAPASRPGAALGSGRTEDTAEQPVWPAPSVLDAVGARSPFTAPLIRPLPPAPPNDLPAWPQGPSPESVSALTAPGGLR